jgi:endonuclease-3
MSRKAAATLASTATRSSPRARARSPSLVPKDENSPPAKIRKVSRAPSTPLKPVKSEAISPSTLRDKKLKSHNNIGIDGPFPTFLHPTPDECDKAHKILVKLHGPRNRPVEVVASTSRAGCGDSPNVLDALVRTILSQNTSDTNSTRAKLSMDKAYGRSDKWDAIASGGQAKLEESIRCGGLSQVKSKVILRILEQTKEKYGNYTLDHLHKATTEDAMAELLAMDGVGPKTASCVLLFCLQRDDFAVDTHVHRITGLLGWHPKKANREQTYQHLNRRIPDEYKYALHILIITHGKRCDECKAGGRNSGKCELRKAFREIESGVKLEEADVKPETGTKEEGAVLETMQDEDVKPDVKIEL